MVMGSARAMRSNDGCWDPMILEVCFDGRDPAFADDNGCEPSCGCVEVQVVACGPLLLFLAVGSGCPVLEVFGGEKCAVFIVGVFVVFGVMVSCVRWRSRLWRRHGSWVHVIVELFWRGVHFAGRVVG
jgi:hypothetical protein